MPTDESHEARRNRTARAIEKLEAIYSPACSLCEIRCGVDRRSGERGVCGLAANTRIYRRFVHLGEERPLVPSYAVWMAGCNFLCSFCSDSHALRPPLPGDVWTPRTLASAIIGDIERSRLKIRNINFVGGEPSLSLPFLAELGLELLDITPHPPPLLLNTNGYLTEAALEGAIDLFDCFLVDFKFGSDDCSRKLGGPTLHGKRSYGTVLRRNLQRLESSDRELWVRHLLMPGHLECCTRPVIETLESHPRAHVNVMPAFVAFDDPWRSLLKQEKDAARELFDKSDVRLKYWDGEVMKNGEPGESTAYQSSRRIRNDREDTSK